LPRSRAVNDDLLAIARARRERGESVTSTGSFRITVKNAFRSKATARSVFGRHRPATNSRYRSTSRSPSR
jgi:hypothetical protein